MPVHRAQTAEASEGDRRTDLPVSVGALADIAVLRVEKGEFGFVDSYRARMAGDLRLLYKLTIHDGIVVYDLNGITRDSWDRLGNYQPQGDPSWDGTRSTGRKAR